MLVAIQKDFDEVTKFYVFILFKSTSLTFGFPGQGQND